jgi:hypothetical protein
MAPTKHLLIVCYGAQKFYNEATFLLLSLCRWHSPESMQDVQIHLYTEHPERWHSLPPLPITIVPIAAHMATWSGANKYTYRIKTEALAHLAATVQGAIIQLDTDTVIAQPLDQLWHAIAGGQRFMHLPEGTVQSKQNPTLRSIYQQVKTAPNASFQHSQPLEQYMLWNSGLIGLQAQDLPLIHNTLQLIDALYDPSKPIRVIEQYALSIVLADAGTIAPAYPFAIHYWCLPEANIILDSFFAFFKDQPWQMQVFYALHIQWFHLLQEKMRFSYNRTPKDYLLNQQWQPHTIYNWVAITKAYPYINPPQ